MTDTVKLLTNKELPFAVKEFFAKRFALDFEIKALEEEHLKELKDERRKLVADFKTNGDFDMKEIKPFYDIYKLEQEARRFVEDGDRERRELNLDRLWGAVKKGDTFNFMSAFDAEQEADPMLEEQHDDQAEDEGETGHSEGDDERAPTGPAELTFASAEREEADPMLEETAEAWGQGGAQQADGEAYDRGGVVWHAGVAAGRAGKTADDNEYEGEEAELWERGRAVGAKEFIDAEAKAVADEHEAEDAVQGGEVVNLFDRGEDDDDVEIPVGDALISAAESNRAAQ